MSVDTWANEVLARERPELPQPLEPAALSVRYGGGENARCSMCERSLTTSEFFPDFDDLGDGNEGTCADCLGMSR